MDIPKKLKDEIWEFCHCNDITNVDGFIETMIKQGFNIEKYGTSPFGTTQEVEPPKPEIIEKIIEVEKIVEKIVEKRIEVPVEVIKEIVVEKKVYITNDSEVKELTDRLEVTQKDESIHKKSVYSLSKKLKTSNDTNEELTNELDALRQELDALRQELDVKVDEKYKGFWEEEIKSHNKTKEEITKLKDIIKHINSGTADNDIYGDRVNSKGWWAGESNIKRKK